MVYHLTHRCHDRAYLFRFARDRNQYRKRLREAVLSCEVSLLSYTITHNHVHLLAYAEETDAVARLMQQAAGAFARDYNRRKARSGAFWEGRYHATMVEGGDYVWNCLRYVELNMVRCGVVAHPSQWLWSGYHELMGGKRRNRLLDLDRLLWIVRAPSLDEFRQHFERRIAESIGRGQLKREPMWTESVAVGSEAFVASLAPQVPWRRSTSIVEETGAWVLRDEHASIFRLENRAIDSFQGGDFELTIMP